MAELLPSQRWKSRAPQNPRHGLRRAILLGSIATSLVLIGDQTLAGALSQTAVQTPSLPSTVQLNLALFTSVAVSFQRSIGSMSERSSEVVSLIVLGLCLLGGGRALTRRRQMPDNSYVAVSGAATPAKVVSVTREAHAPTLVRVLRRAAR